MSNTTNNEFIFSGEVYFCRVDPHDPGNGRTEKNPKKVIPPNRTLSLVLSPADAELAKDIGLTVYPATERVPGPHIKPLSRVDKETPKSRAVVIDSYGDLWDRSILIGNGSKANVLVIAGFNERGLLKTVEITDLVEYERPEGDGDGATDAVRELAIKGALARRGIQTTDMSDESTELDDEIPV